MIAAVVAIAKNNVIGNANDLPWYLPADLKHFKVITTGHTVVMGRKTFESIINRLGKPLPNRKNIVITRSRDFKPEGVQMVHNIAELESFTEDLYIIGGAEVYKQTLALIDRLYITEVAADISGDTYFPELEAAEWREVARESHAADEKNLYNYSFVILERVHGAG